VDLVNGILKLVSKYKRMYCIY